MGQYALCVIVCSTLFAQAKPVWTVDTSYLRPSFALRSSARESRFAFFDIQFSPDGQQLLVSFVQYESQKELATRDGRQTTTRLSTFFWDTQNGRLTKSLDWPVNTGSPSWIRPLATGGYVVLTQNKLQILDLSLRVLRERQVEVEMPGGNLIAASQGPYLLFSSSRLWPPRVQVFDNRSLSIVEDMQMEGIQDITDEQLLSVDKKALKVKRIGGQWNRIRAALPGDTIRMARFLGEHVIAVSGSQCWATIHDSGAEGVSVCYSGPDLIASMKASTHAERIAVLVCQKPTGLTAAFDLGGGACRVIAYDKQVSLLVLPIPHFGLSYFSISPDGKQLACLFGKQLKKYALP